MLIAHITDTHVTVLGTLLMGVVDTASALEQAVAAVNRLDPAPAVSVLTEDLVETGAAEEYAHLRALLARDRAVESWLREEVGPAYDALKDDPSRALTARQVRARLAAARAKPR